MPLMMDNTDFGDTAMNDVNLQGAGMDSMDDLFGEAAADGLDLQVPLQNALLPPPPPPPPPLVERFAEMQTSGACTKLAWSNTGSIARISPDGRKVSFHVFSEDRKTGIWVPNQESASPIYAPEGSRFVHAQFNGLGQDLALVDDVGLVHLYVMPSGLGRMISTPSELNNDRTGRSELDGIVGMFWLPPVAEFKAPFMPPSSKINGIWAAQPKGQNTTKIHHPMTSRSALLQVSKNGHVSLIYQGDGNRWHTASTNLDHVLSSSDLISHASFCAIDTRLMLATYDHAQNLRIFTTTVEWNPTLQAMQTGPPTAVRVAPVLKIGHVTSMEHAVARHSDGNAISSLAIIPPVPSYADPGFPSFPTVLATFVTAAPPATGSHQGQISHTTIAQWYLEDVMPTLHDSFGKLKGNNNAISGLPSARVLRRQQDLVSHRLVLSIQPVNHDTIICLVNSDGTVDFRERSALDVIQTFGDTAFVASLPQSGFEHMPTDHNIQAVILANGAYMAYVRPEGELEGKCMALAQGWHPLEDGISDTRGMLEAAVICLAREHVILTYNNVSTAELTALTPRNLDLELANLFKREICRRVTNSYDLALAEENRKQALAVKDTILPRCLGGQVGLGVHMRPELPSPPTQLAWAVLNIKHAVYSIMSTTGRQELAGNPEAIASLRGLAKYCVDIVISIFDSLLVIKRVVATHGKPVAQAFSEHIAATNTPAIHILLCSYSRVFLRFLVTFLPRLVQATRSCVSRARSLLDKTHLAATVQLFDSLPWKFETLSSILDETDRAVRDAYSPSPDRTRDTELDMLISCSLPEILYPVLDSLITTILPNAIPDLDVGEIYFSDTTWLRLAPMEAQHYDTMRKIPLPPDAKLRHCRRCGSIMEDFGSDPEKIREQPPWVRQTERQCVCTCFWHLP